MKLRTRVLPLLACLLPLTFPAAQASESMSRGDVEKIVHDYMLAHPELLIDMSNALRAKQEAQQQQADVTLIQQNKKALFEQANDPVGGNAKGTVTVVEFFDYNCGYCKRSQSLVEQLVATNKDLRYIYKEFPILTETSLTAAKAALAVSSLHPDKYVAFHNALMNHQGPFKDAKDLEAIAKKQGLSWPALEKKMQDPAISQQLADNQKLAQALGLTGTPAFVINNSILRGAPRTMDDLNDAIKAK